MLGIERRKLVVILAAWPIVAYRNNAHAAERPQAGGRYKIVGPVYVMVTYNSLNDRRVTKETATGFLHSKLYYKKAEVALQELIAPGTIMTIVGPAPKRWPQFLFSEKFLVRLEPIAVPSGLDLILALDRGIGGSLDGLNPELFSRA